MSTILVPVYATESLVHYSTPQVEPYETTAIIGGKRVAKTAQQVLIKFIDNDWVEQDSWSIGSVAVTKATNPSNGAWAYLLIPVEDFFAVANCCVADYGASTPFPPGSGMGSGGGYLIWDEDSTVVDEEEQYEKLIEVEYDQWDDAAPLGVYISGNMQIDWGDGILRTYPDGTFPRRQFTPGANGIVKIYHDDTPTNLTVMDSAGGFRGVIAEITGDIPPNLEVFQTANYWNGTLFTLPATVRIVGVSLTSLTATKLNALLDDLIAGGVMNGRFSAKVSPREDADLAKLHTLISRNWFVLAYGIYPNF